MKKTIFNITKMDCPSEEQLIRMRLKDVSDIYELQFDIAGRCLTVYHDNQDTTILQVLEPLNFDSHIISTDLALIANWLCLYLLSKNQNKEIHIKASMIFTSNDIIINIGVIAAGALTLLTHSSYPDLIIGMIVFVIVLFGARNILKLAK